MNPNCFLWTLCFKLYRVACPFRWVSVIQASCSCTINSSCGALSGPVRARPRSRRGIITRCNPAARPSATRPGLRCRACPGGLLGNRPAVAGAGSQETGPLGRPAGPRAGGGGQAADPLGQGSPRLDRVRRVPWGPCLRRGRPCLEQTKLSSKGYNSELRCHRFFRFIQWSYYNNDLTYLSAKLSEKQYLWIRF